MNRIILTLLLCFAFQVCKATDTDELHEETLHLFDSDWSYVKTQCLFESIDSWERLRTEYPHTAYNIAKFWRRKADIGTIDYQRLLSEKMREEFSKVKLTETDRERLIVKYQGAIPESVRCYLYDHASEIARMIDLALDSETTASMNSIKTKERLEELRKMRNQFGAKANMEAQKAQQQGKEEADSKALPSKN